MLHRTTSLPAVLWLFVPADLAARAHILQAFCACAAWRPVIDWSAETSRVLEAIGQVRDEAVREMLTREYDARGVVADSVMSAKEKARILAQKRALAAEVAKSLGPKILDRYVGEYDIEQLGYTLSVSRTQDGLYSRRPGQAPDELLPLSETRFFTVIGADVYDYEFTLDGANQAGGLVITGPGQRFTGKRE